MIHPVSAGGVWGALPDGPASDPGVGWRPVLCLMDTGIRSDSFGWERVRLVILVLPE